MPFLLTHLPILPILLPMLAGTLLLFSSDSRHGPRLALSILALLAQFAIALLLLAGSDARPHLQGACATVDPFLLAPAGEREETTSYHHPEYY